MRLWSLNPRYLDRAGLLAVWREGLLAKKVLAGKTAGYQNHPQLMRFKEYKDPVSAIDSYLYYVFLESRKRRYCFDRYKISGIRLRNIMTVTKGQLQFEMKHLLNKLAGRDPERLYMIEKMNLSLIEANPVFEVIDGDVECWEREHISGGSAFRYW